jgi:hypothetical protein
MAVSDMTTEQRTMIMRVIKLYVNDIDDTNAAAILARDENELDSTRASYSGSPSLYSVGDYVRIDGPSIWIELEMDPGYPTSDAHIHSVWRDKRSDYGGTKS